MSTIEYKLYEPWMKDQVVEMFYRQYGTPMDVFSDYFDIFYDHPFQKNKSIRIVADDNGKIAGFQSFFYWPYQYKNKIYYSLQSGNSLVHPDFRGRGIFQNLLKFIENKHKVLGIDFLVGFPVEASKKNFLKDKWKNILNLRWHVKFINPLACFSNNFLKNTAFTDGNIIPETVFRRNEVISLVQEPGFNDWRKTYSKGTSLFSYTYNTGTSGKIIFHLKKNKRKKILNELIIGSILFTEQAAENHLEEALRNLISSCRRSMSFHFVSIATNEGCWLTLDRTLEKLKFKKTSKFIYFIVKPFCEEAVFSDASNWLVFRSDIDTW